MGVDISVIWFAIIVFATLMYIIMDGFDLGIGMLFYFERDPQALLVLAQGEDHQARQ